MKLMLKCNEAQQVCDKSQYNEASFWERKLLNMHLLICRLCRIHVARNSKLTETINRANLQTIDPKQKEILKDRLRREMTK